MYKRNQTSLSPFYSSHFMQTLPKIFILLILSFPFLVIPARAELTVGIGPEHFLWTEYFSDGVPVLEESGFRYALNLHWEQERLQPFRFGYEGKLYFGDVNYHGQTLFPPIQHFSSDTAYSGIQNEGNISFRPSFETPYILDLIAGLGWDHWSRNISPKSSNQLEEYDILYLKLGPLISSLGNRGPWIEFGGKIPFFTAENAHIIDLGFDQNPQLQPGKQISFYLNTGVRFNTSWEGKIYFDSYRFSESPKVPVSTGGVPTGVVYQPQIYTERWGIQFAYHFP